MKVSRRKRRKIETSSKVGADRELYVQELIRQVARMVEESGEPCGFDAAKWVSKWLNSPIPALGGKPSGFMKTVQGRKLVSSLLATAQSGAYS